MSKKTDVFSDLSVALSGKPNSREKLRVFAASCIQHEVADAVAFQLRGFSSICAKEKLDEVEGIVFRPYNNSFHAAEQCLHFENNRIKLPAFIDESSRNEHAKFLHQSKAKAVAVFPFGDGWIEFRFQSTEALSEARRFLLSQLIFYFRHSLVSHLHGDEAGSAVETSNNLLRDQFQQLAEYGNLLVIRTDENFSITEFFGDTDFLFGIAPAELQGNDEIWTRVVHPEDLRRISRLIRRMADSPGEINEEVRIIHALSKTSRWFMLRAVPYTDAKGNFAGWEGFGVDISEKRKVEEDLRVQSRRVEALYEVARAVQSSSDSSVVSLKGLHAVMRATNSDCGFSCFYYSDSGRLEIIAARGLSPEYLEQVEGVVAGNSLVRHAVEQRQGILLDNIQNDPRANVTIARDENLRSTIVMPLQSEGDMAGAIVLFCRKARRYSLADFELVSAAASQIALAIRQAQFYAAEKRQADSVAIMYRLSHELSKLLTPGEVAEHAFPIVQEVLSCKRMWLGVINEQGTHLIGQGGFGPGVRRSIKEIQIELDLRHDYLDEAIRSKRSIVVPKDATMQCSGLNRLLRRLAIGSFVIIPLVSLGRVIGVFLLEPTVPAQSLLRRKLPLLSSMAGEIASVILARRFESKMANADKMRMAGLLASGVAHNFNNLLQAVMGQASLIEMQVDSDSPIASSSQTIVDAATKGAALIKQLLSFSMQDGLEKREIQISELLDESRELYTSLLGSSILLKMEIEPDAPLVEVDYGQVQQIITNLLLNAKEAIEESPDGFVRMHARKLRVGSSEIDPELPPGDYLRLDIEDNGVGMDAERVERCFEPFYTSKDVDANTGIGLSGSGLGLSSAYSIARRHGGVLTVTSVPGEGSIFSLYLPIVESKPSSSEHPTLASPSTHRVLICSVEDSISNSLRSMFYSLGFQTRVLESYKEIHDEMSRNAAQLLVFDADRYDGILEKDIQKLLQAFPNIYCIVATVDTPFWSEGFSSESRVSVVEKPLGVWAIQPVVRKIVSKRNESLDQRLEQAYPDGDEDPLVRLPRAVGQMGGARK